MSTNSENKKWFCILATILCCSLLVGPVRASTTWQQTQKLTASDGAAVDRFGFSVSINGNYAIIGAWGDDDRGSMSGSAYIFKWDGTGWNQQQKLTVPDGAAGDSFGWSVSISDDKAIVGAYCDDDRGSNSGSAYIFKRNGESWVQQQKLTASDGAAYDWFGYPVSISGDKTIVGACLDDDRGDWSGSAYIFTPNDIDPNNWIQQQKLTASDGAANDEFGRSVSISGDKTIMGAHYDDDRGSNSGSAYIFKWNGASWIQQNKLTASDGAADDEFGRSVSISGDYAIIGAWGDDGNEPNFGSAYIFKWDGENWSQQQKLTASDGAANDEFGRSVSISGDYAIIGARADDDWSGSAYIFKWDGTNWVQQQKLTAADGAAYDELGYSVSISGDKAVVGAHGDDDMGGQSGSVYTFMLTGTGTLMILQPNGGENLVAGLTYDIIWDTNGVVENVFIEYSDNNGVDWTAIDTVANTGSCHWLVPEINSNQCLVRISDADYPPASDVSDDVFRIYVSGTLTVLSPNGGEKLLAGSTYNIIWDTNGVVEEVLIEYSENNGSDWTTINTVANTGLYHWLVPEINSNQCLVQISDAGYPPASDVSDDVFRIYVCADWLTGDLSSDCFVNFWDFAILGGQWFQTPGVPSADIAPEGGDGMVNFLDLGVLVDQWLKCGNPADPNCQQ